MAPSRAWIRFRPVPTVSPMSPTGSGRPFRSGGPENLDLASIESLRQAIEVSLRGILIVDPWGLVRYANAAAGALFDQDPQSFIGRPIDLPLEVRDENRELDVQRMDGTLRRAELRVLPTEWNKEPGYLVFIEDVTERDLSKTRLREMNHQLYEANQRLARMVLHDPLTDLLNRRGLAQALDIEMRASRRRGTQIIALLVDLDDFKRVNDTYGHAVGDVVLRETALKLASVLREADHVARIGGDEFMVLLPDVRLAEGLRVAEKVRLALSESPPIVQGMPLPITASIGLVPLESGPPSIDALLAKSSEALSASKRSGKNRVTVASDDPNAHLPEAGELEVAIRHLRDGSSLKAVVHPILRLADERRVGFEFLSRSNVAVFEAPTDFFRLCLDSNSLTAVDRACFDTCVQASQAAPTSGWRHLNLFPSTMIDVPAERLLAELPRESAPLYCVEISEQQIVGDPSYLVPVVQAFRAAGVRIALDDIGFGRSCMESLILLEPEVVKVDRRCVHEVDRDPARLRALGRLLRVLRSTDAQIVAEGIETRGELETLRSLGIEYGQGFLWGPPAELAQWTSADARTFEAGA